MTTNNNWVVAPFEGSAYVKQLLDFLLPEFIRIFGKEIMKAEKCAVFNDPKASCPMLIIGTTPVMIRLAQYSTSYWAQTIYQLSHELCHYAIRQRKQDKEFTLKWLEETMCEAMSLYALEWAFKNWHKCPLSEENPSFSSSLFEYLKEVSSETPHNDLRNCVTLDDLRICNELAECRREGRICERNILYVCISKHSEECCCFGDMYRYLNDDKLTVTAEIR